MDNYLDNAFIRWLIEKEGAYYDEQGELCVPAKIYTSKDINDILRNSTVTSGVLTDEKPSHKIHPE